MPRDLPTILLTGFGPFPGIERNASEVFVRKLAPHARRMFASHRVVSRVLATEWHSAPRTLAGLYRRTCPALALHFGVSTKARGLVLETRAANAQSPMEDAAGELPGSFVIAGEGARELPASIPVRRLKAQLEKLEIPVELSRDAGTYLCNAVLYHSLLLAEAAPQRGRAGFVHLPAVLSESRAPNSTRRGSRGLDMERAVAGALEIIRFCLETDRRG